MSVEFSEEPQNQDLMSRRTSGGYGMSAKLVKWGLFKTENAANLFLLISALIMFAAAITVAVIILLPKQASPVNVMQNIQIDQTKFIKKR